MRPVLSAYGAWLILASGVVTAIWAARTPIVHPLPEAQSPRRGARASRTPAYAADSLSTASRAHDVFRSDRRPVPVAYDPFAVTMGLTGPPPPAPKPTLLLEGIVWGAVPEAVLEGIPGADGPRVLRVGETLGGVRVQRIEARRVVIAGMDTTWTLTLRYPWR